MQGQQNIEKKYGVFTSRYELNLDIYIYIYIYIDN